MLTLNKFISVLITGLMALLLVGCDSRPKSCLAMKDDLVKITKADKNFSNGAFIQSLEKVSGVFSDETMMECAGEVILSDNTTADIRYKAYKTDKEWKYEVKREYKTPECSDENILTTVKNTSTKLFKQSIATSINNRNARALNGLSRVDAGFAFFGQAMFKNASPDSINASVQEVKFLRSTKYDKETKIRSCDATIVFDLVLPKDNSPGLDIAAIASMGGRVAHPGAIDSSRERKFSFTVTPDELNKGNFIIETQLIN